MKTIQKLQILLLVAAMAMTACAQAGDVEGEQSSAAASAARESVSNTSGEESSAAASAARESVSNTSSIDAEKWEKKIKDTLKSGQLIDIVDMFNEMANMNDIPEEERKHYVAVEQELRSNLAQLGDSCEPMLEKYIKTDALHADIGSVERTANGVESKLTRDLGAFQKYVDLVFEKTGFQKMIFKKDCLIFFLRRDADRNRNITFTLYSEKLDNFDESYQKGYISDHSLYEERTDDQM